MIDKDLCRGSAGSIYVYAKFGLFLLVGFVRELDRSQWKRTKVHVRKGSIEPRTQYHIPGPLLHYINERAKRAAGIMGSLSARQSEKIDASFKKTLEKFVGSDEFIAMQYDVEMFRGTAFTREKSDGFAIR